MNTSPETSQETFVSKSPAQTRRIARDLLTRLPRRVTLALHGDLGSGKTCFVQGLAAALGIVRSVTSPTFIIVNEYRGERPLFHIDLYRLGSSRDAAGVGLEEYTETDGITAIEWAERAADVLPPDTIHIRFETTGKPTERKISILWPGVGSAPQARAARRRGRPGSAATPGRAP